MDLESTQEQPLDEVLAKLKAPQAPQPYLFVIAGDRVGDMIKVDRELTIGRGAEASYRLDDPGISRVHVRLRPEGQSLVAEDLGSRNGTFVNGQPLTGPTALRAGDKLQLGSTVILKFSSVDGVEQQFQERLFDLAIRDPLTGLYNRRYLSDRLQSELSFAVRHGQPLTVAMLDLDHFKQVNDVHGHASGDAVLQAFGGLLSSTTRAEDVVARYGGEEFTIVMRQTGIEQARCLIERLRRGLAALAPIADAPDRRVTVSVGLAASTPALATVEELLKAADDALYVAKRAGRDCVRVHTPAAGAP